MNLLPGWFPAGAAAARGSPALAFLQFTEDTVDATTFTFLGQNLGAADPTRRIVVAVTWGDTATPATLASATIAGVAATIHIQLDGALQGRCALISALVPTGTSGSIVINLSGGTPDRCSIGVYRAINETVATHHAVASDLTATAGLFTTTIAIPANGWVVAVCAPNVCTTPTNSTWVGVTETYDGAYGDALTTLFRSGGFASGLPLEAARTVSCTLAAGTPPTTGSLAAMSWG